jgi:cell wall-associated NlpC family hydrolase
VRDWWAPYVGKPFAPFGQGPDFYNCWGLVRAVYREQLGLDLPSHDEIGAGAHRAVAQAMQQGVAQGPWIMAEPPQAFDVMVARRDMHSRYPGHVGVMIDEGRALHIWEGRDVHISRVGEPTLSGLILGFYRHRSVV